MSHVFSTPRTLSVKMEQSIRFAALPKQRIFAGALRL